MTNVTAKWDKVRVTPVNFLNSSVLHIKMTTVTGWECSFLNVWSNLCCCQFNFEFKYLSYFIFIICLLLCHVFLCSVIAQALWSRVTCVVWGTIVCGAGPSQPCTRHASCQLYTISLAPSNQTCDRSKILRLLHS